MKQYQHYFDVNKELWNERTVIHKSSSFYDLPSFLQGASSLKGIELNELGDIKGKSILHLQCHFGMDSLSMERMGARVTGVDLSDVSIAEAKKLNAQLSLNARFICSNIYDLDKHLDQQFDIVFTSYGVIGWLPDLQKWAGLISRCLKPGGFFYMVEFHPVVWMFDDEFQFIKYDYSNTGLIEIDGQGTYTDGGDKLVHKEYSWNHGLSEVINSLLGNRMQLNFFNEFSYSPYPCFQKSVQGSDGNWRIKGLEDKIPMCYSLKATRMP